MSNHRDREARKEYERNYAPRRKELRDSATPEQLAERKAKQQAYEKEYAARRKERLAARLAVMSPDELAAFKAARREARARYDARNPDKVLAKSKRAQARNKERYHTDPEFRARWDGYQEKYRSANYSKILEQGREYAKTPEAKHLKRLAKGMIFQPGQTEESMVADQNGLCAICQQTLPDGKHRHVDHCHKTGHVRAVLCHHCNVGLGAFRDNPDRMRAAIEYLREHDTRISAFMLKSE